MNCLLRFESIALGLLLSTGATALPGGHSKSPTDGHFKIPHLSA